jgi:hypothetical protein
LRSTVRRSKQVRFRRQRVPVEIPPEESAAAGEADAHESEKIEVHVHVHRGEGSKRHRSKRAALPVLTGALFDWQWYKDRICARPRPAANRRWSLALRCQACDAIIPPTARCCPRCAGPRPRRRLLPALLAVLGLASVAVVFALCVHALGDSAPAHKPPSPLGQWSDDDFVIVEVPAQPNPFAEKRAPSSSSSSTEGTAKTQ